MEREQIYILIKTSIILIIGITSSLEDIKEHKVSNIKIIAGIILITIINFCNENWLENILSGIFIFLIYLTAKIIMKRKLGWGDVYYSIFTGLSLKPAYAILSVIISVVLAELFIVVETAKTKNKRERKQIAFIPFMTLGLFISYIISLKH